MPREHTTFGPEHRVAGRVVEGVAEGWAIPLSMWSGVNCVECVLLELHCVGFEVPCASPVLLPYPPPLAHARPCLSTG